VFDHILGNFPVRSYLVKAIAQNQLPHALLFAGKAGIGKNLFAKALAAELLHTTCDLVEQNPDFYEVRAESKAALHTIEKIREVIDEVHISSFRSFGKVFVIHDADRMQSAAANALLKTLEEPTENTTFILLTENIQDIMGTIRSRCVLLPFHPLTESEVATFLKSKGLPEHLATLSQGSIAEALALTEQTSLEKTVFGWLSTKLPSHELLQQIESFVEPADPIQKHTQAEHVFSLVLMWYRDQHARRLGVSKEYLLFPQEEAVSFPLPSMEIVFQKVTDARIGFQRNIKLSTCFSTMLLP